MKSSPENPAHSRDTDQVLVIMAKAPRPGAVKTRLTPILSPQTVTAFYRCLLEDTLALARSLNSRGVEVAIMCPASDVTELAYLANSEPSGSAVSVVPQKGEGLAAGLTSVFAHFTPDHHYEDHHRKDHHKENRRVIAFNSDSPHLPPSVLESAFNTLKAQDVVVGPTHDGGYYLVGAKAAHPMLFESDGMGTNSALHALLARARGLQLSIGFTEPFFDIDVEGDLTRLAEELRLAPARAPRTAAWLKQWEQAVVQLRTPVEKL